MPLPKLTNSRFKPVIDAFKIGYSDTVEEIAVDHGTPILYNEKDYAISVFSISMVCSEGEKAAFQDFYVGKINHGADPFKMDLDFGFGLEEKDVYMVPKTLQFNGNRHPIWVINFSVRCIDD